MQLSFEALQGQVAKLAQYANMEYGLQVLVVLAAIIIAASVHRLLDSGLSARLDKSDQKLPREIMLRSSRRLIFPLAAFLVIIAGRMLLQLFGYPNGLLDIAAQLLVALAVIRMLVYGLRVGFAQGPALKAWEKIISTSVWSVVALHLVGWLQPVVDGMDRLAINVGDSHISLLMVVKLVLLSALYLLLAFWISGVVEQRMRASRHINASMRVGLAKVIKFSLITLAILVALTEAGLNLASLTVLGGAIGIGIGFGLQKIVSNFISGFILLGDRSIRPGDVITVGDNFGWVKELRARYIVVRNRDGVETLIPNENLVTTDVINWSYSDRKVRVRIPVQISYDDDPEEAMAIMLEAGKAHPRALANPEPVVRLMEFADSGIALELRVWMTDPQEGVGNIRSDINLAIWRGFKEAGITIPFPQRDVHLRYVNSPAETGSA
jgi:small-conductance mechanosensitive channel